MTLSSKKDVNDENDEKDDKEVNSFVNYE